MSPEVSAIAAIDLLSPSLHSVHGIVDVGIGARELDAQVLLLQGIGFHVEELGRAPLVVVDVFQVSFS